MPPVVKRCFALGDGLSLAEAREAAQELWRRLRDRSRSRREKEQKQEREGRGRGHRHAGLDRAIVLCYRPGCRLQGEARVRARITRVFARLLDRPASALRAGRGAAHRRRPPRCFERRSRYSRPASNSELGGKARPRRRPRLARARTPDLDRRARGRPGAWAASQSGRDPHTLAAARRGQDRVRSARADGALHSRPAARAGRCDLGRINSRPAPGAFLPRGGKTPASAA